VSLAAIELFAGGGGAALGLYAAGVRTLARCEWDEHACATLRAAAAGGFLDRFGGGTGGRMTKSKRDEPASIAGSTIPAIPQRGSR
jgi:site-specific DNA-cytosine methylase